MEEMTIEEFNKLPFQFVCHLNMGTEHTITYEAKYNGHTLGMCHHTPYDEYTMSPRGRSYTHYRIDKDVYKTKKKFLEALETLPAATIKIR